LKRPRARLKRFKSLDFLIKIMTAIHPAGKKREMRYSIDQNTCDEFIKACSRKGLAPQVLLEQAMKRFIQTGQI